MIGWRLLGGVIVAIPGLILSFNVVGFLPLARSDSPESGLAVGLIVLVAFITVPFILLGGYLAFYPLKKGWRCTSCGFVLGPPPRSTLKA